MRNPIQVFCLVVDIIVSSNDSKQCTHINSMLSNMKGFPGTTAGYNLLKCSHLKAEETLQVKEEELTKLTKSEVNSGYREIHGKSKKITRAEKDVELAAAAADKAKDELEEFKWTYPEIAARLEREETQFHCSYSRLYTHRQDYK
ncbi:hypothetical protein FRC02_001609 [Tulasnella sp. 418]|nr:hypothetical protein FRC02_001609 [Tulasnella sp. 418]